MDLSNLLFQEAVRLGLCKEWQKNWEGNFSSLMDMYKRGMDFCVKNDYPSLDILRRYLKGKTSDYNIFIDEEKSITVYSDTIVALGDSKIKIYVEDYGVVNIYARHNSELTVYCGKNAIVSIETYDESIARVVDATRVSVYQYDKSEVFGDRVNVYKRDRHAT